VYKRDYAFRMNVMEKIFEIKSCIKILANDIKVDTTDQSSVSICSTVNRELQGIHIVLHHKYFVMHAFSIKRIKSATQHYFLGPGQSEAHERATFNMKHRYMDAKNKLCISHSY